MHHPGGDCVIRSSGAFVFVVIGVSEDHTKAIFSIFVLMSSRYVFDL
ncbi:hypothetical protein KKG31_07790 [Patescibacteria group bacterium]|nr:hypothetical protein [Patescibacteria group bacterium]MBU1758967.1 hypothetical protein [Patescibacteria group bacterium]